MRVSGKAAHEADAAECQLWSELQEGFGGPAQPSPTIAPCLNGGYGCPQVKCRRCETEARIPLEHVGRPRDTPIWKLKAALKCRSCRTPRYSPPPCNKRLFWRGSLEKIDAQVQTADC
jgi:hypothetical protein